MSLAGELHTLSAIVVRREPSLDDSGSTCAPRRSLEWTGRVRLVGHAGLSATTPHLAEGRTRSWPACMVWATRGPGIAGGDWGCGRRTRDRAVRRGVGSAV